MFLLYKAQSKQMAIDTATLEISELEKHVLLLVHVDDKPIYGRQKLQFMMYMLSDTYQEIRDGFNYAIKDDGPYSVVLDNTIEHLVQRDLLIEKDDVIKLTQQGIGYVKNVVDEKNKIVKFPGLCDIKMPDVFSNHKSLINDITIPEMLSFMYCEYPDLKKKSTTYEKLKPDIKEHVFSMLTKGKFSVGGASELLGIPLHLMMDEAAKRGLLWTSR